MCLNCLWSSEIQGLAVSFLLLLLFIYFFNGNSNTWFFFGFVLNHSQLLRAQRLLLPVVESSAYLLYDRMKEDKGKRRKPDLLPFFSALKSSDDL